MTEKDASTFVTDGEALDVVGGSVVGRVVVFFFFSGYNNSGPMNSIIVFGKNKNRHKYNMALG
jgi:hypothetical protein